MKDLIERTSVDINNSRNTVALTGAGISTESGIPDFRGPRGIWTTNKTAEAKAYERYDLFLGDPVMYWKEMMGGRGTHGEYYNEMRKVKPNLGHYALAKLEEMGLLKCIVTQNIDGLHLKAGSRNVIEYHGSIYKARCPHCGTRKELDDLPLEKLPPSCNCGGVMKLDVVHFKESIPSDVMEAAEQEVLKSDLILLCGTSAVVYPFAGLPIMAKMNNGDNVKIIEINEEPTSLTREGISDYILLGKTGQILPKVVELISG